MEAPMSIEHAFKVIDETLEQLAREMRARDELRFVFGAIEVADIQKQTRALLKRLRRRQR
jgi:hypothetical protein